MEVAASVEVAGKAIAHKRANAAAVPSMKQTHGITGGKTACGGLIGLRLRMRMRLE